MTHAATAGADADRRLPPVADSWQRRAADKARSIAALRDAARRRLPRAFFDFIDGGAEDELTLKENSQAYRRIGFMPRVLVDVSQVDMAHPILGTRSPLPFAIGPTGGVGFSWPLGDIALAQAADKAGIPFTLSTTASVSIEHLRRSVQGRLWFQCYIFRQREFTLRLIARALAADYEALIITVDLPVGGNRERDFRNDFAVPFRYTPRNVTDFARHPGWVWTTLRHGLPHMPNLEGLAPPSDIVKAASSVGRNYDPSFSWDDLAQIRDLWPRKLIVKGVVRPDDTERLAAMGVDAVVVSNHGGRQLDGAPATIAALPGVKAAAGNRMPVFVDGGIRRGSDIVKALASGADAVLLGRATLYGLAAAGAYGAGRAVSILESELKRTMQLCGATRIADIDGDLIRPAP